jgi:hypothetical protein
MQSRTLHVLIMNYDRMHLEFWILLLGHACVLNCQYSEHQNYFANYKNLHKYYNHDLNSLYLFAPYHIVIIHDEDSKGPTLHEAAVCCLSTNNLHKYVSHA